MHTDFAVVFQEFQHKLIAKIYRRIREAHGDDRNFDFCYDWLQHPGFETLCVPDFNTLFVCILCVFDEVLRSCQKLHIVNIATDIMASIAAIHRYPCFGFVPTSDLVRWMSVLQ